MDNWIAEIVAALPDSIMITQEIGPRKLLAEFAPWLFLTASLILTFAAVMLAKDNS